jgi:hypothetical protein
MHVQLEEVTFRKDAKLAQTLIDWIEARESPVTIRRVFYAMVSAGVVSNTLKEYKHISRVVTSLRRGGYVDWNAITDGTRGAYKTPDYESALECASDALDRFRMDRWRGQPYYVEVWIEKRGLSGMLFPETDRLDVTLRENGGKRALSEELVLPLLRAQQEERSPVILYVGDYDPSGLRMDENMEYQLAQWGVSAQWRRVALTFEHLDMYNLPPEFIVEETATDGWLRKHPDAEILGYDKQGRPLVNKLEKDTNAQWFKERHGGQLFQVEVDALEEADLRRLVRDSILDFLEVDMYNQVLEEEGRQRTMLRERIGG